MSPDRGWFILRKFYPPQTALTVSEEYLLFPLRKIVRGALAIDTQNAEPPSSAFVVYPLGQNNAFMSNIGVKKDQVHIFKSRSFFWSEDSRAIVFADSVGESLNAVLVQISEEGPMTLVRSLSADDICELVSGSATSALTLFDARISAPRGDNSREVQMKFESSSAACQPKTIDMSTSEFYKPEPEEHPSRKRNPSTEIQH